MTINMKDWIQGRAGELALGHHGKEYYTLPSNLQEAMWFIATKDFRDLRVTKLNNILIKEVHSET